MEEVRPNLPEGMTITVGSDESQFISRAIKSVWHTLAEAAVLVVLVIFLFLGSWRATQIPAVTVPICLLGSFAILWLFGFSINLLTLLAMVLTIGLVVDGHVIVAPAIGDNFGLVVRLVVNNLMGDVEPVVGDLRVDILRITVKFWIPSIYFCVFTELSLAANVFAPMAHVGTNFLVRNK